MIRAKGYKVAIIFDQPGISRGQLTVEDVDRMNDHMIDLFGQAGCPSIDGTLYNMSDLKHDIYSKPNTGMLKRLRDEMGVPLKGGYYVGDRLVDAKMADRAKLKPVLVKTGKYEDDKKQFNSFANRPLKKKTKIYDNLLEFAESLQ
jgi:HAD superfamily hydrolase (TIGR01662 family)